MKYRKHVFNLQTNLLNNSLRCYSLQRGQTPTGKEPIRQAPIRPTAANRSVTCRKTVSAMCTAVMGSQQESTAAIVHHEGRSREHLHDMMGQGLLAAGFLKDCISHPHQQLYPHLMQAPSVPLSAAVPEMRSPLQARTLRKLQLTNSVQPKVSNVG